MAADDERRKTAFKRRVRFSVQFELPELEERGRLWRSMFPAEMPLAPDIVTDQDGVTRIMERPNITGSGIGTIVGYAGVEPGDIILKVDGKSVEKSGDLPRLIGSTKPGAKSRVCPVRCTTWYEVANSAQPPKAKITALVCSGRRRP